MEQIHIRKNISRCGKKIETFCVNKISLKIHVLKNVSIVEKKLGEQILIKIKNSLKFLFTLALQESENPYETHLHFQNTLSLDAATDTLLQAPHVQDIHYQAYFEFSSNTHAFEASFHSLYLLLRLEYGEKRRGKGGT